MECSKEKFCIWHYFFATGMVIGRFLWRMDMEERSFPAVGTKCDDRTAVNYFYLQCRRDGVPVPDYCCWSQNLELDRGGADICSGRRRDQILPLTRVQNDRKLCTLRTQPMAHGFGATCMSQNKIATTSSNWPWLNINCFHLRL